MWVMFINSSVPSDYDGESSGKVSSCNVWVMFINSSVPSDYDGESSGR